MARWYVQKDGQVTGPYEEAQVIQWIQAGMRDAFVAPEGGSWLPVQKSHMAAFLPGKKKKIPTWTWVVGIIIVLGIIGTAIEKPATPGVTAATNEPKGEPPKGKGCVLKIPGSDGAIAIFPTEAGFEEWSRLTSSAASGSASDGEKKAAWNAIRANDGFIVPAGTKCFVIDPGITRTKVRVLEGPNDGKSGWVPSEWR